MNRVRNVILRPAAAVLLALAMPLATPAITIKQRILMPGLGGAETGGMDMERVFSTDGERGREESSFKFSSKMMNKLAGQQTVQITLPSQEKLYQVDVKRKKYIEWSFAQFRSMREQGLGNLGAIMRGQGGRPTEERQARGETYEWSEPVIEVTRPGGLEMIAGLEATQTRVSVTSRGKHLESGRECIMNWKVDLWNGAASEASRRLHRYQQSLAQAMGLSEAELQMAGQGMMGFLNSYGAGLTRLQKEMAGLEGLTLRQVMTLGLEGECEQDEGGKGGKGGRAGARGGDDSGGGMAGMKKLFGGLRRGKKDREAEPQAAPAMAAADGSVFTFTVETYEVDESQPPAAAFAPPVGFEREEAPMP